jgi:hypothetical protein
MFIGSSLTNPKVALIKIQTETLPDCAGFGRFLGARLVTIIVPSSTPIAPKPCKAPWTGYRIADIL